MNPEQNTTTPEQQDAGVAGERQRAADITNIVRVAKLDSQLAGQLIADGTTVERARAIVFDRLATQSEGIKTENHVRVGDDRSRGQLSLMAEALAARFGGPPPSNDAREFIHVRTVDMARYCLELRGVPTRTMAPHQIVQRALHTTSDFSSLLTESGNRILRQGYNSYQGGVRRICKESTAPDFRAKSKLMLGEAPALVEVGQGGEVTRGTMAESKASYSLATYARIFGISRQALVNDDLSAFADLTAGAISIATLGEGLKMMRLQKGLDSTTPIDVTPKFLVVPAALEVVARQYVAQINATKSSDVNPFTADLEPVVDPRLDASSATAWYLAADGTSFDTIEYSFLESEPGPQIETNAGFDVEGVEMKVRLDFGCGVIDHRGLFKNAGA
jgi:hypothetical protein